MRSGLTITEPCQGKNKKINRLNREKKKKKQTDQGNMFFGEGAWKIEAFLRKTASLHNLKTILTFLSKTVLFVLIRPNDRTLLYFSDEERCSSLFLQKHRLEFTNPDEYWKSNHPIHTKKCHHNFLKFTATYRPPVLFPKIFG